MRFTKLATKIFFYRPVEGRNTYDNHFLKEGGKLMPQDGTTPYACNEMEYQATLSLMDYFFQTYRNNRLFLPNGLNQTSDLFVIGEKIEGAFFDSKYPGQNDFENLARFYKAAYLGRWGDVYDENLRTNLKIRYLESSEKLIDFDKLLNRISHHTNNLVGNISSGLWMRNDDVIYAFRNNYSLLFLNFSSSVWYSQEKPLYLETNLGF